MKRYTVQCGYAGYFANTVVVEAETLEAALEKAVETANAAAGGWRSLDHCGPTFVQAAAEGIDANPWDGAASALPIPDRFAEGGEPPVVTLTGRRPTGAVEVTRGRVRLRFVEREGTVVADVSDPPPPPVARPLVIVRRRADGAPHVTVAEGRARVRVLDEIVPDRAARAGPPPGPPSMENTAMSVCDPLPQGYDRHREALFIVDPGACNPSGVALAVFNACRQVRDEGGDVRTDPAVRLMTTQLAFLVRGDPGIDDYDALIETCRARAGERAAADAS